MAKFVKKEKMVSAWEFTGTGMADWMDFAEEIGLPLAGFGRDENCFYGKVSTIEGNLRCYTGHMVVKDRRGIFTTMPRHVFDNMYSEVPFEFDEEVYVNIADEQYKGKIVGSGKFSGYKPENTKQYLVQFEYPTLPRLEWFPVGVIKKVDN